MNAEQAKKTYRQTETWCTENPSAWQFIRDLAQRDYRRHMPMSIRRYAELLRAESTIAVNSKYYRLPNSFCAVLARMLIQEHPEYNGLLKVNHCALDEVEVWGEVKSV